MGRDLMVAQQNFEWNQGEDLIIHVTYRLDGQPQDLTGYTARMDIAALMGSPGPIASLYTFNTDDNDPDTEDEIVVGADGTISITVPRSLTLGDGVIAEAVSNNASSKYKYDLFLRDLDNKQRKILEGEITVRRSVTKWM